MMDVQRCRAVRGVVAVGALLLLLAAPATAGAQASDGPMDGSATTTTTTVAPPLPPPSPVVPGPSAAAAGQEIRGLVVDGDTGERLEGLCVLFFAADQAPPAADGMAFTGADGWFSFTPATDAPQYVLIGRPTVPGDCSAIESTGPVPEWLFDGPVDLKDPFTPPREAAAVVGPMETGVCMGHDQLHVGDCSFDGPRGPATISGTVRTITGEPVDEACVFALGTGSVYGPAVSAPNGGYVITGLPEGEQFYVGFIPPFDQTGDGPCSTGQGPPPASEEGELQPELFANTWIDLTDPSLDGDPSVYAAARGAGRVVSGAVGVDECLSTDPGAVTPRPPCEVAAAQATAAAPMTGTLALTGGRDGTTTTAVVGGALVALGAGMLLARRRLNRLGRSAG
jgi:hypothetical protein